MLYLKQISYFSKVVYQVICLALQNTVFIKISYKDHQGYIICLYEISSGTSNDVTEQLRETLVVKEREAKRIKVKKSWAVISLHGISTHMLA